MENKSNTGLIIVIIILVLILVGGAIGVTIYFMQKNAQLEKQVNSLSAPAASTQTPQTSTSESPTEVVTAFMNHSLGTLPSADLNFNTARKYLSDNLKAQFADESAIPVFFKIQDGPTSVKFISERISGDTATVRVDPSWGETALGWAFTLEKQGNEWKITEFRNDAQ